MKFHLESISIDADPSKVNENQLKSIKALIKHELSAICERMSGLLIEWDSEDGPVGATSPEEGPSDLFIKYYSLEGAPVGPCVFYYVFLQKNP